MKRYVFLIFLYFLQNSYSQSFNYEKYYSQVMQKAEKLGKEMGEEWVRTSEFATRSTNKEVYVLYLNGSKAAYSADEFGCKGQINIFKGKLESLIESVVSGIPSNVPKSAITEFRNGAKQYMNNITCSCKKENNPNYQAYRGNNTTNGGGYKPTEVSFTTPAIDIPVSILTDFTSGVVGQIYIDILGTSTQVANPLDFISPPSDNTFATRTDAPPVSTEIDIWNIPDDAFGYVLPTINPFSEEVLQLKKKALEDEYWNYFTNCLKYEINSDCDGRFKPMREKIELLNKLIDGGGEALISKCIENNKKIYATQSFENNVPWDNLSESINNPQRLTTVMNQLVQLNSGSMPEYITNEGGTYYFKDKKNGTTFFVSKDGEKIEYIKETIGEANLKGTVPLLSGEINNRGEATNKFSQNISTGDNSEITVMKNAIDVDFENSKELLNDFEKSKNKWTDLLKASGGLEFTTAKIETTNVYIDDKGGAWKIGETLEFGKIGGNLSAGVQGAAIELKAEVAGAEFSISYIQQPKIDIQNDETFKMQQPEYSIKGGGTLGGKIKYNYSTDKIKAEVGGLIKGGVGWENSNTNKNINYLPDDVQKNVVKSLLEQIIK